GDSDPEIGGWLLERALGLWPEDAQATSQLPVDDLERAIAIADREATGRLFTRQAELAVVNRARLEVERSKLVRFYEYRERSATEKLESTRRTVERLQASDAPEDVRILPVWVKNLDTAERRLAALAEDRERRVRELDARDQVAVQQQMVSGA